MSSLKGKKILVGVTGSIAAYKAAFFVRLLVKEGTAVQVILTPQAAEFVAPLTFSTLTGRKALVNYITDDGTDWNNHVDLGMWSDLLFIAPATANTIAKMAHGMADNLLLATYLSAKCPVMVAPAMDLDMYEHAATKENLKQLKSRGNHIIAPQHGVLASGLVGEGRLPEPADLLAETAAFFQKAKKPLAGTKSVVTAGPTVERIDPVRYISNHSSGKMGIAIAKALAAAGSEVILLKGPTTIEPPADMKVVEIQTARELLEASEKAFQQADIFIAAAAVSDYRPKKVAAQKIKKHKQTPSIELEQNPDILKEMGARKKQGQTLVGFALETENGLNNAHKKLSEKNLDFIVLNSLGDKGAGFQHDTNKISIIDRNNNTTEFELKPKQEVANDIVNYLIDYLHA